HALDSRTGVWQFGNIHRNPPRFIAREFDRFRSYLIFVKVSRAPLCFSALAPVTFLPEFPKLKRPRLAAFFLCYPVHQAVLNSSGSLAMFAALLRASSCVSNLAADRHPGLALAQG